MNPLRLRFLHYAYPLAMRVADARRRWRVREGVLCVVEDERGQRGYGEAAPLPGFGDDSFEASRAALDAVDVDALSRWSVYLQEQGFEMHDAAAIESSAAFSQAAFGNSSFSPSARFALEAALLDLHGVFRRCEEGASSRGETLPLAKLLGSGSIESASTQEAWNAGYRCFKLKIGSAGAFDHEVASAHALRNAFPGLALRLDANASLPPAQAAPQIEALNALGPEFVEEPWSYAHCEAHLPALSFPLALDESLASPDAMARIRRSAERAKDALVLVLKPGALGLLRSLALAAEGRRLGARVVLSHLFEGPIAWGHCASLAFALQKSGAAGLAPHADLETCAALVARCKAASLSPSSSWQPEALLDWYERKRATPDPKAKASAALARESR